jgi:hypothetical protein
MLTRRDRLGGVPDDLAELQDVGALRDAWRAIL